MNCRVCHKSIRKSQQYNLFVEKGNPSPFHTNHHEYAHLNCAAEEVVQKLPDYMVKQFNRTSTCWHCSSPLNHLVHAFNHWKKYHSRKRYIVPVQQERQRFFVWAGKGWVEVDMLSYLEAHRRKIATAYTKPRK